MRTDYFDESGDEENEPVWDAAVEAYENEQAEEQKEVISKFKAMLEKDDCFNYPMNSIIANIILAKERGHLSQLNTEIDNFLTSFEQRLKTPTDVSQPAVKNVDEDIF